MYLMLLGFYLGLVTSIYQVGYFDGDILRAIFLNVFPIILAAIIKFKV